MAWYIEDRAKSAKYQPREALDVSRRCLLPRAEPLPQAQSSLLQHLDQDCRAIIWEYVLRPPETRIERWRIPDKLSCLTPEESDADCFPYRLTAAEWDKSEKPLNLLLCCRQVYLEGLALLYSTTFVFERPLDLYDFQLCVSPEGLANVKRLIVAFGQIDYPSIGPFSLHESKHPLGSLEEWEHAVHGMNKMKGLHDLQVWLGHRHVLPPEQELRPWKAGKGNQEVEQRHQRLFELFGTVNVPSFGMHLTWRPADVLAQRSWPFRITLHTEGEMTYYLDEVLPWKTEPDLYNW